MSVPGRVNLIGEHIDYHNLPVLPMAIERRVSLAYRVRNDRALCATSAGYHPCELSLDTNGPLPSGDWVNYVNAAIRMATARWPLTRGIDAAVVSDLPLAAGLSSSSALLTAFALALLDANGIHPTIAELMEVLPEGEQYVGTRGGGMDHAAVLAGSAGNALRIDFAPLALTPVPLPQNWAFLVAHSLTIAEKSGAARLEYNARRTAGLQALARLDLPGFRSALARYPEPELMRMAAALPNHERDAFMHVVSEAHRVDEALEAIRQADLQAFGRILVASHASLRDYLKVSNPTLDRLVTCALDSGAAGARLTGAGFGGCVIVVCERGNLEVVRAGLIQRFYPGQPAFVAQQHLLLVHPSPGALSA